MKRWTPLLAALIFATFPARAGIIFTSVTRGEGAPGADMQDTTVKGAVEGPKARFTFEQTRNPSMSEGSYLITHDGGDVMYLVNPAEKSYMKWDLDEMMGMAGGFMKAAQGMIDMKVSDHKVEKLVDEKGPNLHGFPTRHLKYRTSYTMETSVFGMKNRTQTQRTDEMWITTALDDAALTAWKRQRALKTGNEDLDKLLQSEILNAEGFPLKQVITTTNTGEGNNATTTVTTEITKLTEMDVADELFKIPDGYKEVTMEEAMQEAGRDSSATTEDADNTGGKPDLGKFLKMFQNKR